MSGLGRIHFKFKSSVAKDSVEFDGHYISVGEVKRLIAIKKGLGEDVGAELELSDPQTKQVYKDDTQQLHRNASVLVRRVPAPKSRGAAKAAAASYAALTALPIAASNVPSGRGQPQGQADDFGDDPYEEQIAKRKANLEGEDADISARLAAEDEQWRHESDRTILQARQQQQFYRGRGGRHGPGGRMGARGGRPGESYFCSYCGAQGKHFRSDCPKKDNPNFELKQVRAPAGIPTNMLAKTSEGGLLLPTGEVGSIMHDEEAYARELGIVPVQKKALPALADKPADSKPVLALPEPGRSQPSSPDGRATTPQVAVPVDDGYAADELAGLTAELGEDEQEQEMMDDHDGLFDEDEEDYKVEHTADLNLSLGMGMDAVAQQQKQQQQKQKQAAKQQQPGPSTGAQKHTANGDHAEPAEQPAAPRGRQATPPPAAAVVPAQVPETFEDYLPHLKDLLPRTWPLFALEEAFYRPQALSREAFEDLLTNMGLPARSSSSSRKAGPAAPEVAPARPSSRSREQKRAEMVRSSSRELKRSRSPERKPAASRDRKRSRSKEGRDVKGRRSSPVEERQSSRQAEAKQPSQHRSKTEAGAKKVAEEQAEGAHHQELDLRVVLSKSRAQKQRQQQEAAAAAAAAAADGHGSHVDSEEAKQARRQRHGVIEDRLRVQTRLATEGSAELFGLLDGLSDSSTKAAAADGGGSKHVSSRMGAPTRGAVGQQEEQQQQQQGWHEEEEEAEERSEREGTPYSREGSGSEGRGDDRPSPGGVASGGDRGVEVSGSEGGGLEGSYEQRNSRSRSRSRSQSPARTGSYSRSRSRGEGYSGGGDGQGSDPDNVEALLQSEDGWDAEEEEQGAQEEGSDRDRAGRADVAVPRASSGRGLSRVMEHSRSRSGERRSHRSSTKHKKHSKRHSKKEKREKHGKRHRSRSRSRSSERGHGRGRAGHRSPSPTRGRSKQQQTKPSPAAAPAAAEARPKRVGVHDRIQWPDGGAEAASGRSHRHSPVRTRAPARAAAGGSGGGGEGGPKAGSKAAAGGPAAAKGSRARSLTVMALSDVIKDADKRHHGRDRHQEEDREKESGRRAKKARC